MHTHNTHTSMHVHLFAGVNVKWLLEDLKYAAHSHGPVHTSLTRALFQRVRMHMRALTVRVMYRANRAQTAWIGIHWKKSIMGEQSTQ